MASLPRHLRKQLENAVRKGRRVADEGARKALEGFAVAHHEPWPSMKPEERVLRNRLRRHGRQLGDNLDAQKGTQAIEHLSSEIAYEHWHRMLFARFLAENDLLIEPTSGMAVSIDEVRELAHPQNADWIDLAAGWAQRMLPQIFRNGDPALEVTLPPEAQLKLEEIVESLPPEVFLADDSLGWVYQFWQAEKKDEVNARGVKIGEDELPAVTQLFTEDYMVDFLLDNTLGAWWAGKKLAENPDLAAAAMTEEELRAAVALPGAPWSYLRFFINEGRWTPAAGTFGGWPKAAKEVTCLDPCMGSGHFIVAMLARLVPLRIAEEQLSEQDAVFAVIEKNIFGLEIDPRCTQIAAFNVALAAWKRVGHCAIPSMNLSCSGLGIHAKEEEWIALAGNDDQVREALRQLYKLFAQARILGSLIDTRRVGGDLFTANFEKVRPLLQTVLELEEKDERVGELAVTARGIVGAAATLSGSFTLVATNVPYLGRGKQNEELKAYCERIHAEAKADLANCFIERSLAFCLPGGATAMVTPQNWLFLGTYRAQRESLLARNQWPMAARLGANAFRDMNWWAATTALVVLISSEPSRDARMCGLDVSFEKDQENKAALLRGEFVSEKTADLVVCSQAELRNGPDARIVIGDQTKGSLLRDFAESYVGMHVGDNERFCLCVWEFPSISESVRPYQTGVLECETYGGRHLVMVWPENGRIHFENPKARVQGKPAWGRRGVSVRLMGNLATTLATGEMFEQTIANVVPKDPQDLPAIWEFCKSDEFRNSVRRLDQKVNVTSATLVKVPFDRFRWQDLANKNNPTGLPTSFSSSPTQWLFDGRPNGSDVPLQTAIARLVSYSWPRQTGTSFPDCPELVGDGLEKHADPDGIVCLTPAKGEAGAADRLRALLADAYGTEWSPAKLNELLERENYGGRSLEEWLREGFFVQHCDLFHQRPFVWQIWDGVRDGFSGLVNYHKLAAPNGEGRKTLEKLRYSYLGDWIERQRGDQKRGVEGADLKLAAAEHLAGELEKILQGEPPYDLFIRWKPLHEQPIGWDPDITDGVRMNIRPFMNARLYNAKAKNACILRMTPNIKWKKDRGNEATRAKEDFPWFWGWDEQTVDFKGGSTFDGNRWNDLHYARAFKESARAIQRQK
ncbi:MAG TPA: hypothetical protein VK648_11040 [Gemmatimonadaceae bacterium]|nr:MAG: restriction endonuclease subunit M [Acidobacteriota bacterium]HTD84315.1 hypothetical protein [Gemmatimonadaceae bacterium]